MKLFNSIFIQFYDRLILKKPGWIVFLLILIVGGLGYQAKDFRLDASAESLMLQNDEDLQYSRQIEIRYKLEDFLLISFTPKNDLFSEESLSTISNLKEDLVKLPRVTSVVTILDVPLLESSDANLKEMLNKRITLESPRVDRSKAKKELTSSPLYKDLLVSSDARHTALQINLKTDVEYQELLAVRHQIFQEQENGQMDAFQRQLSKDVSQKIQAKLEKFRNTEHKDISDIRAIMKKYEDSGELFLGGVDMIADDMLTFIRSDLEIFGVSVFLLMVIILMFIFQQISWIILLLICCIGAVVSMIGILGLFQWEVTVVSSNFISLQLIITLAMVIHLFVQYRELLSSGLIVDQKRLVIATLLSKAKPCLYSALTTVAGFSSLFLCDILPIINFGWMMSTGILISLVLTFLIFPVGMMMMGRKMFSKKESHSDHFIIQGIAKFTHKQGKVISLVTAAVLILSIVGITKLEVENSFIDYFNKNTEIHQGMKKIDQHLGGTTPLDIIVHLEPNQNGEPTLDSQTDSMEEEDEFSEFDEFEETESEEKYWFTADKMTQINSIHAYLDQLPEVGKVLSLSTFLQIAQQLNDGKALDNFQLALVFSELPEELKSMIFTPYVNPTLGEVRFSIRVKDSLKTLKRDALLKKIKYDLENQLQIPEDQFRLAGMMVLYNNLLQSLFRSQILTLGAVVTAIFCMFLILFRSWRVSLIALFPNLIASGVVLGVLGWLSIPLDVMTITIAAISIGIAVDNTIHYIHRFKIELSKDHDYVQAMYRSHESIGHALYYTTLTVVIGFSILALSRFLPTTYFGIFTGLAMFIALIACLTLLPYLLIRFKPFDLEKLHP